MALGFFGNTVSDGIAMALALVKEVPCGRDSAAATLTNSPPLQRARNCSGI
jgi:hypothetical protein